MKKLLIPLLAILIFNASFGSVQPIKIKTVTIEESIERYWYALNGVASCATDADACKLAFLQTTNGVKPPTDFLDEYTEEEIKEKIKDFFDKTYPGGLTCTAVRAAAYWFYLVCAENCPTPYQGQCTLQCASNYVTAMYNANCMGYL